MGFDPREKEEEDKRVRQLQRLVDLACSLLYQEDMSMDDALRLIQGVKGRALRLFPDKEEAFDLIYGSRFRRILMEKFPIC